MTTDPNQTQDPIRVPNVHAHAVSGLDHTALGSDDRDALNVSESVEEVDPATEAQGNVVGGPDPMPDTTGLIASSETTDDTSGSAADGTPGGDSSEGDNPTGTDNGTQDTPGEDLDPDGLVSDGGDPIDPAQDGDQDASQGDDGTGAPTDSPDAADGQQGSGEATDVETGEVTPAGEQLPTIAQEGGTPLDPPTHDGTED